MKLWWYKIDLMYVANEFSCVSLRAQVIESHLMCEAKRVKHCLNIVSFVFWLQEGRVPYRGCGAPSPAQVSPLLFLSSPGEG